MVKFIIRRLVSLVPVLLGVSLISFLLLRLAPGDPAAAYLHLSQIPPTEEAIAAIRAELGLDRPWTVQYLDWLKRAVNLDFGKSYTTQTDVWDEIMHFLPATAELAAVSLLITLVVSIPLAIVSALHKDGVIDQLCQLLAFVSASIPTFWLGFLLMYYFSVQLDLLPALGRGTWLHYILPAATLSFGYIATYIRLLRTTLLENLNQPFVLYARARGLSDKRIVGRHVLKHALLPVLTATGMSIGHLLAGSVIVETVFAWPGLGRFCLTAILNRDYPVVQCLALLSAVTFVMANLLVDIAYAWLDPRLRLRGGRDE